jgi:hypothetical protein
MRCLTIEPTTKPVTFVKFVNELHEQRLEVL